MTDDLEVTTDRLSEWLQEPSFDGEYGDDVETPRDWLKGALKTALDDCKRPMGRSDWAYELAVTMVPAFPEIVLDYTEYSEDDVEFSFDWDKFHEILHGALDALIGQELG